MSKLKLSEQRFNNIKKLLSLPEKEHLTVLDVAEYTATSLATVHTINEYDSYYAIPKNRVKYISKDGLFTRYLLNDYGNGRYRLSCTNNTIHNKLHKNGKCGQSSFWTDDQIKLNGYSIAK